MLVYCVSLIRCFDLTHPQPSSTILTFLSTDAFPFPFFPPGDKSFKKMSDSEWDLVMAVHLKGAFECTKACWPIFRKQKYGRILNTSSAAGLYGNMGQANYSSAKSE